MFYKVINEGESGVIWKSGRIVSVVDPGVYYYSLLFGRRIQRIGTLESDYQCPLEEYTTADNVAVRFFVRAKVSIADPAKMLRKIKYEELPTHIQNTVSDAARRRVLSCTLDDLLAESAQFSVSIENDIRAVLDTSGLMLHGISPVSILIPRSLKQAFEAEMTAKKKAVADLEEARGRTATLRHLANAADMVEKRPILLQLLLGQKARNVQFQFETKDKK